MFVSVDTTCPDVAKAEHEAAQNVHERVDAQKCKDAAMFAMLPDEQVIERATSTECKMRKGMPAACNSGSVCEQLSRLSTDQVLGSYAAIRTSQQVWVRSGCNATCYTSLYFVILCRQRASDPEVLGSLALQRAGRVA